MINRLKMDQNNLLEDISQYEHDLQTLLRVQSSNQQISYT